MSNLIQEKLDLIKQDKEQNLLPENLREGVVCLGVEGTFAGGDYSKATATASDILAPKVAYTATGKTIGEMQTISEPIDNESRLFELPYIHNFTDIRYDLKLALTYSDNNIYVYSINDDNTYTRISSIGVGTRVDDAKFGKTPMFENDEVCVYNIFAMINSGSWSNVYEGCTAYRYDVINKALYSGNGINTYVSHNEKINGAGVGYYPGLYTGRLIVLDNVHCMAVMRSPGRISSAGDCNPQPRVYKAEGTYMQYKFSATQACYLSSRQNYNQHGLSSLTGRLYMTVISEGWQLVSFNESFTSYKTLASSTTINSYKPCMLKNEYIYNDCVFDTDGNIIKEYNKTVFKNNYNYKFFHEGFIYEMNTSTQSIYKYSIDDSFNIKLTGILSGKSVKSYDYANFIIGFPITSDKYVYFYDSASSVYRVAESTPSGNFVTNIFREGFNYQYLDGLTLEGGHQLLRGVVAGGNNGKVYGTIEDKGATSFTPKKEIVSIPSGYYHGANILPVDASIDNNIIPEYIKKGVTILGVTGNMTAGEGESATSDVALQAKYLLEGYTAVVDDKLIVGTMRNYGSQIYTAQDEEFIIPSGFYTTLTINPTISSDLTGYEQCSVALSI